MIAARMMAWRGRFGLRSLSATVGRELPAVSVTKAPPVVGGGGESIAAAREALDALGAVRPKKLNVAIVGGAPPGVAAPPPRAAPPGGAPRGAGRAAPL